MSDPVVAEKRPAVLVLKPGETYWWCACGLSKNQPYCDGSHEGTDFSPIEFTVEEKKNDKYALCQCKRTANAPFCDGAHRKL
jgi:CDGSH-type Zn-finger protein